MEIDRKHFLLLAAAGLAGCALVGGSPAEPGVVDAGPVEKYAADGVYSDFRRRGFFLIRQRGRLFALSSVCTHRRCRVTPESNRTFTCDCHGSTFDADGHVTMGPATRDLPVYFSHSTEGGRLLVTIPAA